MSQELPMTELLDLRGVNFSLATNTALLLWDALQTALPLKGISSVSSPYRSLPLIDQFPDVFCSQEM